MENTDDGLQPIFSHAEPVLAVQDIAETIRYWHEVIGFPVKWTWGEPPTHGSVSWQKVFVQFTQNPALATASKGNSIWIRVQRIASLYNFHQKSNADIVAPLEHQPWGMAQYTIRDNNGYLIHFAGQMAAREKSEASLPSTVVITARRPSIKEYQDLVLALYGEPALDDKSVEVRLEAIVFAVVAEDVARDKVIGCALAAGDNASFYYVKDVWVHPAWQGKLVGTAMMKELTQWLQNNGADNALIGLFSGEALEPFYQQFGFTQAFGMLQYIQRDKKED